MAYKEDKDPLTGKGHRHVTASILASMGLSKAKIEPDKFIPYGKRVSPGVIIPGEPTKLRIGSRVEALFMASQTKPLPPMPISMDGIVERIIDSNTILVRALEDVPPAKLKIGGLVNAYTNKDIEQRILKVTQKGEEFKVGDNVVAYWAEVMTSTSGKNTIVVIGKIVSMTSKVITIMTSWASDNHNEFADILIDFAREGTPDFNNTSRVARLLPEFEQGDYVVFGNKAGVIEASISPFSFEVVWLTPNELNEHELVDLKDLKKLSTKMADMNEYKIGDSIIAHWEFSGHIYGGKAVVSKVAKGGLNISDFMNYEIKLIQDVAHFKLGQKLNVYGYIGADDNIRNQLMESGGTLKLNRIWTKDNNPMSVPKPSLPATSIPAKSHATMTTMAMVKPDKQLTVAAPNFHAYIYFIDQKLYEKNKSKIKDVFKTKLNPVKWNVTIGEWYRDGDTDRKQIVRRTKNTNGDTDGLIIRDDANYSIQSALKTLLMKLGNINVDFVIVPLNYNEDSQPHISQIKAKFGVT